MAQELFFFGVGQKPGLTIYIELLFARLQDMAHKHPIDKLQIASGVRIRQNIRKRQRITEAK
jgi:hypothetical protein